MILDLPFPAKILWPNGRGHHMTRHKAAKKHKGWARAAALAERRNAPAGDRLRLVATIHPKPAGPAPDKDNSSAALKAYQDGIAWALGVDDRHFAEPEIRFAERVKGGRFVIEVIAI